MSLNQTLIRAAQSDDVVALHENRSQIQKELGAQDENGRTLVHLAVASNATNAALWLLDNRLADVQKADNQGETPLMRAAWLGQGDVVATLLVHGAKLEAASRAGATALHYAYEGGTPALSVVEQLIVAGAKTDVVDGLGRKPEELAAVAKAREEAAKLLVAGAVGSAPGRSRMTLGR